MNLAPKSITQTPNPEPSHSQLVKAQQVLRRFVDRVGQGMIAFSPAGP